MYDFKLITLLVHDEFGEGIPVAWAITNREDTTMLVEFLTAIKTRTGTLTAPTWFMSDDAEQYFTSWKGVFGAEGTTKLLCAWHVDRSWRNALKEHVATTQARLEIYHHLRVLLMENEESNFRVLLQQFLEQNEKNFCLYFKAHYCSRLEQWASCFRIGTVVNTNMFVEAFHRVLKVVNLQQKQNRRIDFLLASLLKIARDKVFERLTKLEKGKYSHRVAEINKRHKSAVHMLLLQVPVTQEETGWRVPSQKDGSIEYIVRLVSTTCDCKLTCTNCHACVHTYTCTCMDATLHATVCKHVHLVRLSMTSTIEDHASSTSGTCSNVEYFSSLLKDTKSADIELPALRQQVQHQIDELITLVNSCQHAESLKASTQHLTSAITVIKALEHNAKSDPPALPQKRQYSANKNAENSFASFLPKKGNLHLLS